MKEYKFLYNLPWASDCDTLLQTKAKISRQLLVYTLYITLNENMWTDFGAELREQGLDWWNLSPFIKKSAEETWE
jgi:hypothetical protein